MMYNDSESCLEFVDYQGTFLVTVLQRWLPSVEVTLDYEANFIKPSARNCGYPQKVK